MRCEYRIVKKSEISYSQIVPERMTLYVLQEKWLFFWCNMYYDDTHDLMAFETLKEAKQYLNKLKNI